jgi:ZIP family zinc transporter
MNTEKAIEQSSEKDKARLLRMGLFSALAIGIHNFPEGLATFMSGLSDPALGFSIAVAIAIHNIPEGLAVSAPIYFATQSRKKAFVLSFLSGLAEPIGALIGFFLLKQFFNDLTFGFVFAGVAGIMVYISLDELLPTAEEYGEHHLASGGLIAGMLVMAVSLLLFLCDSSGTVANNSTFYGTGEGEGPVIQGSLPNSRTGEEMVLTARRISV